jgi:hypothetical protein
VLTALWASAGAVERFVIERVRAGEDPIAIARERGRRVDNVERAVRRLAVRVAEWFC